MTVIRTPNLKLPRTTEFAELVVRFRELRDGDGIASEVIKILSHMAKTSQMLEKFASECVDDPIQLHAVQQVANISSMMTTAFCGCASDISSDTNELWELLSAMLERVTGEGVDPDEVADFATWFKSISEEAEEPKASEDK